MLISHLLAVADKEDGADRRAGGACANNSAPTWLRVRVGLGLGNPTVGHGEESEPICSLVVRITREMSNWQPADVSRPSCSLFIV